MSVGLVTIYGNNGPTRLARHLAENFQHLGIAATIFNDSDNKPVGQPADRATCQTKAAGALLRADCPLVIWLTGQSPSLLTSLQQRTRVVAAVLSPSNASAIQLAAKLTFGICFSRAAYAKVGSVAGDAGRLLLPLSSCLPVLRQPTTELERFRVLIPGNQLAVDDPLWFCRLTQLLRQHDRLDISIHRLPHWLTGRDRQAFRQLRREFGDRVQWYICQSSQQLTSCLLQQSALLWHDPSTFSPEAIVASHLGVPVVTSSRVNSEYLTAENSYQADGVLQSRYVSRYLLDSLACLLQDVSLWQQLRQRNTVELRRRQSEFQTGLLSLLS